MRNRSLLCAALALAACSTNKTTTKDPRADAPQMVAANEDKRPASSGDADVGDAAALSDASIDAAPAPLAGEDFEEEAKLIFRMAACGGDDPVPAKYDAATVDAHCKELLALIDDYKKNWVAIAMPYIAPLVPKGLPDQVVYPFGGGDLMSALATFPDKPEFTTISLETAADIRKVDTITPKQLKAELALNRLHLGKLFEKAHSRTVNLDMESKSDLPGEIVFTMVALVIHGYEPVSLRYFKFNPDGTLRYLEAPEINNADAEAKKRKKTAADLGTFDDMELQFRKAGDSAAPLKTLRHVAYNLDDKHMKADPSLLRHLEAKGKVTAMTKAASHFIWSDDFSIIRKYLLDHMEWMISDSTGVPPRYATKAGFVQDTYGEMEWPAWFGPVDNKNAEDLRKLFKTNPQKDLPFRYGYPDRDHHAHMMITRRP